MYVKLLNAATATNSAPSGATAGFSLRQQLADSPSGLGGSDRAILLVKSTAGSATMTVTIKMWGYSPLSAAWHPMGAHATDASRGLVNLATAIGEVSADNIAHSEIIQGLHGFTRVYAEITAIGGTSTAISAWLTTSEAD